MPMALSEGVYEEIFPAESFPPKIGQQTKEAPPMTTCCRDFSDAEKAQGIYRTSEQFHGELVYRWMLNMANGLEIYYCPFCGTSLEKEEE
jgi:rubrerythrin